MFIQIQGFVYNFVQSLKLIYSLCLRSQVLNLSSTLSHVLLGLRNTSSTSKLGNRELGTTTNTSWLKIMDSFTSKVGATLHWRNSTHNPPPTLLLNNPGQPSHILAYEAGSTTSLPISLILGWTQGASVSLAESSLPQTSPDWEVGHYQSCYSGATHCHLGLIWKQEPLPLH